MTMPAARRTPGVRFDLSYSGTTNRGTGSNKVYLLGEILATATMSEGDIVGPIGTTAEATLAAGAQSILAYMASEAMNEENGGKTVPIYLVGLAEPAGVKANGTFIFAGNAASDYELQVKIAGKLISTLILSGSTPTAAGDLFEASVDAFAVAHNLPITAANAVGTVTIECTQKGTVGNLIKISVEDMGGEGTQTCTASGATLASGTLEPTMTTALAALDAVDTDFLAVSVSGATNLGAVRTHMVTKTNSTNQLGGVAVWASTVAVATDTATSIAVNALGDCTPLCFAACEGSRSWQPAIAAGVATVLASEADCAMPHNGLLVNAVDAPDDSDRYTVVDMETLLQYGITPLRTELSSSTGVKIIRAVSVEMSYLDPLDLTKPRTLYEIRDRCKANIEANCGRVKLKKDGQPVYSSNTVTPASVMSLCIAVLLDMEAEDKVQGVRDGSLKDRFKAVHAGNGRIELTIPTDIVDGLHDVAGDIVLIY